MGPCGCVPPLRTRVTPTSEPLPLCSRELWALHGHRLQAMLRPIARDRTSRKLRFFLVMRPTFTTPILSPVSAPLNLNLTK